MEELEAWLALSAENVKLYNEIVAINHDLDSLAHQNLLNTDESWVRFKKLSEDRKVVTLTKHNNRSRIFWISSIAATLVVALSIVLVMWRSRNNDITILQTKANQHLKIILPDGSKVQLNSNSEVCYSRKAFSLSRELKLVKGEALFEVIHNEKYPFVVYSGVLKIKDIGTIFNIRNGKSATIVSVISGVVALSEKTDKDSIKLMANQEAIYNVFSKNIQVVPQKDLNTTSWLDKKFRFIKCPLKKVVEQLQNAYEVRIDLSDKDLENKELTASFNNESMEDALKVISGSLNIDFGNKNGIYYLKSKKI
ncbi:DUF4974 domain-containing protein [Mucilaginibacter sp. HC2]|uniref:FecR family protein n=1 Tax=Mucilaginibacter inviolabilis TaxID=2714892 RepID=UPI0014075E39|nr:FecR domain-containing protein [Mucilaginibacter inviolabilis]NHA02800.1 DUF4974 domain-containing protein [Mucilaginibacter inviolabilis]